MEVLEPLLEAKSEEEVGLTGRRRRMGYQNGNGHAVNGNGGVGFRNEQEEGEEVEEDVNGGDCFLSEPSTAEESLDVKLKNVDIQKILSVVIKGQDEETLRTDFSTEEEYALFKLLSKGVEDLLDINRLGESEKEEIEVEFQKAVGKLDRVHCPNCNSCITKVVIRNIRRVDPIPQPEPIDLLGCLSCFSIFVPSGNCFNLFRIFRRQNGGADGENPNQMQVSAAHSSSNFPDDRGNIVNDQQGGCFNLFWIFKNQQNAELKPSVTGTHSSDDPDEKEGINKEEKQDAADLCESTSLDEAPPDQNSDPCNGGHEPGAEKVHNIKLGSAITGAWDAGKHDVTSSNGISKPDHITINMGKESRDPISSSADGAEGEIPTNSASLTQEIENVQGSDEPETSQGTKNSVDASKPMILHETKDPKTLEILKSFVYGGLVESITSLSVVSSTAAADATTLNILAIGVANLIGGLFIFGHNLRELKIGQEDRYNKFLGQKENFLLHATLAVLSFLIFGLVPPIAYGFSFRQTDDKDLKLVVLAASSLLCIALLAVGKAYIQKPTKFWNYIQTTLYYLTMAVTVSGISYVAGDLVKRLIERLGLFDSGTAAALSFRQPGPANRAWGSL